jgi:uncharacterized protein (TIGR02444 family)
MQPEQQAGREAPAERLWRYATDVYGNAAVATTCLQAQDAHGLDVNLLLFAAWCAHEGRSLGASQVAIAEARCAAWRSEVVEALRHTRRRWKSMAQRAEDYEAIKVLELAAERRQLSMLADLVEDADFAAAGDVQPSGERAPANERLAGNLAAVAAARGIDVALLGDFRQALFGASPSPWRRDQSAARNPPD